jgi:hypothetical protein
MGVFGGICVKTTSLGYATIPRIVKICTIVIIDRMLILKLLFDYITQSYWFFFKNVVCCDMFLLMYLTITKPHLCRMLTYINSFILVFNFSSAFNIGVTFDNKTWWN